MHASIEIKLSFKDIIAEQVLDRLGPGLPSKYNAIKCKQTARSQYLSRIKNDSSHSTKYLGKFKMQQPNIRDKLHHLVPM